MQLVHALIRNFRSLRDVSVEFGPHTALIGSNGAGKSSILKAVERFYSTARQLDADDFFGRDQSQPVEIELTFGDLSAQESETFESRVRDGRLVVTRVFDDTASSGRYYGSVLQNADFVEIRAQTTATAKRAAYKSLKEANAAYADLPNATSAPQVDEHLLAWEAQNGAQLTLQRDDGQFFGFQNASRGALQRHTAFVFIPAVREASADAADGKGSAIGRLLELIVRGAILQRADVQAFRAEMSERYQELVAPENMPELGVLADRLTVDLKGLYRDAAVGLAWREVAELPVPLPVADVLLSDDGFGGPVDRQGHGLQRAFIFTLLQYLARSSADVTELPAEGNGGAEPAPAPAPAPNLILAIEEPELYQQGEPRPAARDIPFAWHPHLCRVGLRRRDEQRQAPDRPRAGQAVSTRREWTGAAGRHPDRGLLRPLRGKPRAHLEGRGRERAARGLPCRSVRALRDHPIEGHAEDP